MAGIRAARTVELWGGIECTTNRVGDAFHDQLDQNGHAYRASDLELFAGLGVTALRYPLLFERLAPTSLDHLEWGWADERMGRLKELGVRPIVGLVHHGSGPRYTSLLDPSFPELVGELAARVAERYPWVDAYTPINEPMTTARFSGLYGLWYPHGRDDRTFVRVLLHEILAVRAAMRAVRRTSPTAELVQTEDLGRIYFHPTLADEAAFREARRWLGLDLLFGRVDEHHALWRYLLDHGVTEAELDSLREDPCPVDLVGVNHYLTSDRLLDPRWEMYPPSTHGQIGDRRFADVEAVRSARDAAVGPAGVLRQVWERYHVPVAITEAHLGCTREEQVRWFVEVWDAARELSEEGIDVRAVTAWALLGSFDWDRLVTEQRGSYEPGVFDVRSPMPRPTALARVMQTLAAGREPRHPVLACAGWWHRPERFTYGPAAGRVSGRPPIEPVRDMEDRARRPLAIIGSTGTLGQAIARACDVRGIPYHLLGRRQVDITDPAAVDLVLDEVAPWAVVNAAGWVKVDEAEREAEACMRANVLGPTALAASCARHGAKLVTFSSDLVFGAVSEGALSKGAARPWVESDLPAPLNVYGQSKLQAETRVLTLLPRALVIRTSAFFGPWDRHNFVTQVLARLERGETVRAAGDTWVSPTYVPDLVSAALDLLIDDENGVWHLANRGAITWADLARRAAELAGVGGEVEAVPMAELGLPATRPTWSVLGSERGALLPTLDDALLRYLDAREARPFTDDNVVELGRERGRHDDRTIIGTGTQ